MSGAAGPPPRPASMLWARPRRARARSPPAGTSARPPPVYQRRRRARRRCPRRDPSLVSNVTPSNNRRERYALRYQRAFLYTFRDHLKPSTARAPGRRGCSATRRPKWAQKLSHLHRQRRAAPPCPRNWLAARRGARAAIKCAAPARPAARRPPSPSLHLNRCSHSDAHPLQPAREARPPARPLDSTRRPRGGARPAARPRGAPGLRHSILPARRRPSRGPSAAAASGGGRLLSRTASLSSFVAVSACNCRRVRLFCAAWRVSPCAFWRCRP